MGDQRSEQTNSLESNRQRSATPASKPPILSQGAAHPLLQLQRQLGNRAVTHLIQTNLIQAKLSVSQPNDRYEQEADRVADTVMRMPDPVIQRQPSEEETIQTSLIGPITPLMQRQVEEEKEEPVQMLQRQVEEEKEEPVQAKQATPQPPNVTPDLESSIQAMRGGGKSLPEDTRSFYESRFGYDFGGVRVHTDSQASEAAGQLSAQAFTIGQNIFFNTGRYEPQTSQGKWLLAHELTHTVQQKPGASLVAQRKIVEPQTTGETTTNQKHPAAATKPVGEPAPKSIGATKVVVAEPTGKADVASTTSKESSEPTVNPDTPAASVKAAPKSPKEDPEFGKVMGQIRQTKKAQKAHQHPKVKNQMVADAAHLPEKEQDEYNARKQHLEIISQTANNNEANNKFTAEQFKALLKKQLDELENKLPRSESAAKEFKQEKPLKTIKENVKQSVKDENQKVAAPITTETRTVEPPKSSVPPQTPLPLVEEKAGIKPKPINPSAAAPKPKADPEISMEKESRSLDELMEKNHNTEEQFAESNEPKFQQALKTKKDAQAKAAAAPAEYRSKEQQLIASAQKAAHKDANASFGFMHATRNNSFQVVFQRQTDHDKDDKTEQQRIKGELDGIYNNTKKDADKIFKDLSTFVDETFEKESTAAKSTFEKRVEDQLDDIHGWGVKDFFVGEDTEAIEAVFEREKKIFLDSMDRTLNTIAQRIADDLNKAVKRIQEGKTKAETFYVGLDTKQKELAKDSMDAYRLQFRNLESSVDEKQTELASNLATSYKQNVDTLRKTFDKINEDVKKSWIERAAEFVVEVATTIYNLGNLLKTVLVRVAHVVGDILAHPIRFLGNLAAGIKQGFDTFIGNFDGYLLSGFFDWLRGSVGGTGIKLPDKFDTAGLFSLALQVIGLTYDNFRSIAAEKIGEPVVAVLEKGVEGAEKVYKFFQLAREDIGALWSHIKEVLASAVDEIFEKIKQTVLYETITKVLTYIVTLFNPAGAFIKAAQAIYAGIRFLMDNIERIVALVNAFLDSVELAVKGDVGGIAAKVVFGLQNAIVLGIDSLAKLLNLGNLAEKVRTIIKQLSAPVKRAMGFVVDKVLKPVAKFVKKARTAVVGAGKKAVGAVLGFFGVRKRFSTDTGEKHSLYFEQRSGQTVLLIESTPQDIRKFLEFYVSEYKLDTAKKNIVSQILSFLETYDKDYAALKKVEADSNKAKSIHERLLGKNESLTGLLRTLLSGNRKIGIEIESYLLEGLTGTYSSMPRPRNDILTPDHQPQAAILKWSADLKIGRRKLFSSNSEMAKRASGNHASGGYVINLHDNRHKEGRTFGNDGKDTLNGFIDAVMKNIEKETDDQKARNIIVEQMKKELKADVKRMRDVLSKDVWGDIDEITGLNKAEKQKLKNDIKAQIIKGLNQIENQPMNNLKEK
jgi:hypothetical protein